jgi:hypothetical protein
MTLTGDTGCGISTSHVTFTLNGAGSGAATITSHTSGFFGALAHAGRLVMVY